MTDAATTTRTRPLGDVLVDYKLVSRRQIEEALLAQKQSTTRRLLGEIVVDLGFCTEAQVTEALADTYGVPFARIRPELVDQKTLDVLPRDFVNSNVVLPMFKVDNVLTVAIIEPSNVFLVEEIAQVAGCPVQIVAAIRSDIEDTLGAINPGIDGLILDNLLSLEDSQADGSLGTGTIADMDSLDEEAPVVQLVNHVIMSAVREGASDIHIEPDDGSLRVRYRIDGTLIEKLHPPYEFHAAIASRIKIMASMDISERRLPQDGSISLSVDENRVDLRVSTLPNKFGEKVVIRVIDTRKALVGLEELGLAPADFESFSTEIHKPHGIILVTGPTGSGKSTTLYAVLNEINNPSLNVCTVEDPVEFQIPHVNQFQVRDKIGLSFPNVLRSLLRQDPDVIMIGEIRDPETARTAVQAALTGHLVLSTLHTNDSASAVTRLHNLQIEPYLISASLVAIVAQRLVRAICPDCRHQVDPTPATAKSIERAGMTLGKCFEGRGCAKCNQLGMKGRIGIYELLVPDDEMRDLIASNVPLGVIRERAKTMRMRTLLATGLDKANAGLTTVEEVLRVTTG